MLTIIFFWQTLIFATSEYSPIISTSNGVLKGTRDVTENNRTFYCFTGIPYAVPPLGPLRFEPPQPIQQWTGIYDATKSHNACIQFWTSLNGDENCLYLNVYTPQLPANLHKLLPVMFYIHGGGFFEGSGKKELWGPNLILDKNVVLVLCNYRLGIFGFLSTGDTVVPGNAGLKDQALALRWVKNNIQNFGGDPERITVFGESAGGFSAHLHMFSPLTKDIIKGVIAQSGTALNPWGLLPLGHALNRTMFFASILGCTRSSSTKDIVTCFKKLSTAEIMNASNFVLKDRNGEQSFFRPVVEPDCEGAFLSKHPIHLYLRGDIANVPFLTGINSEEGSIVSGSILNNDTRVNTYNENFDDLMRYPLYLRDNITLEEKTRLMINIKQFYLEQKLIGNLTIAEFTNIFTDRLFLYSAYQSVALHAKYTNQNVYYYLFSYKGAKTFGEFFYGKQHYFGVTHGDDLLYLFNSKDLFPNYKHGGRDKEMSNILITLWTNFAYYGNPIPEDNIWKPFKNNAENYYFISNNYTGEIKKSLHPERLNFWKRFWEKDYWVYVVLTNENVPKIIIESGEIQGGMGYTQYNREYYYFSGIPYAKPPVGWYRFELASPVKPWNGTFDATRTSTPCLQYADIDSDSMIGDEDCLYLNVYTPQLPHDDKRLLPVMFYIGGEQFQFNDVSKEKFGPELLLDKDVVLITINYRLGAFGFFVTEDDTIEYNIGLKDQVFALKWTKRNIDKFGGDPNRITLFGNGAGGASAHYHMVSPLSKHLFNGVIAQSGTALNLWAYAPIQIVGIRSRAVAGLCGCPTQDTNEVVMKCLKTVKADKILNATSVIKRDANMILLKPSLEKHRNNAFLPVDPIHFTQEGHAANVPFLSGINTEDGLYQAEYILKKSNLIEKLNTQFEEIGSWLLYYGITAIVKDRIPFGKKIKKYYFKDYTINESTKKELTNLYTDAWFLEGLQLSNELLTKHSKKPVYNYLFGYRGSESYITTLTSKKNGVCHKDELLYLFRNNIDFPNYTPSESDRKISDLLITLWTNFATYGNPTPPEDTSLPFTWEPVTKENDNYLFIKKNGEVKMQQQKIFPERSKFWSDLIIDTRRKTVKDEL
ncbi:hypothetical protein FQR65_LT06592 [Abscondita terminalis]|nr:hypothetical protein FQR65_LT06592 [Abscondita terminalis]